MTKSFALSASLPLSCLALIALSACAHTEPQEKLVCPQVAVIRDLAQVEDYGQDTAVPANLVAKAHLGKIEGQCAWVAGDKDKAVDPERGINVTFTVDLESQKGPRLGGDQVEWPYFVALLDSQDTILSKNVMTASVKLPAVNTPVSTQEELRVFIPEQNLSKAQGYRVLVGFQQPAAHRKD